MPNTFYAAIYLREKGLRGRTRRIEKLSKRQGRGGLEKRRDGGDALVGERETYLYGGYRSHRIVE